MRTNFSQFVQAVAMTVVFGAAVATIQAAPVLSVDFGRRNASPNPGDPLQSGFQVFTLTGQNVTTTRQYNGNTIDVTASKFGTATLDDWSTAATPADGGGFTEHDLFFDMLLADDGNVGAGLNILVEGLVEGQLYDVTVWSADAGVAGGGARVSDWTANGTLVADDYNISVVPSQTTGFFSFQVLADDPDNDNLGEILLVGTRVGGVGSSVAINGLQITAVPEPSTVVLLAFAAAPFARMVRRRNRNRASLK